MDIGTQFEKSVSIRKFKLDKRDSDLGLAGGEQSRRRSLLPSWNNLRGRSGSKDRSKSKDRFEIHVPKVKEESQKKILPEDALSHNTSNESEDGNCKLARVILPDKVWNEIFSFYNLLQIICVLIHRLQRWYKRKLEKLFVQWWVVF